MKIKVNLSTRSINNAIKMLKKAKNQIPTMVNEFLAECCRKIIDMSNNNLEGWDIGDNVKSDIQSSWYYEIVANKATLINYAEKAVFVEFGTGIVGEENAHPEADKEGYEYNIPTPAKRAGAHHDENTWRFYKSSESDVDIRQDDYEAWETRNGSLKIITRGSPASMFVYNALIDFRNRNMAQTIWSNIKKKYWG